MDLTTLGWAAVALLALFLVPRLAADRTTRLPVYGPWYLPHWVRGLLAIVRLGQDEDAFMLELSRRYGTAVWIPWPMCQTFVVGTEAIEKVYRAPSKTLSFLPIRRELQGTAFGADYGNDRSLMDGQFFPVHTRGMSKNRLTAPLRRFIGSLREKFDSVSMRLEGLDADGEVTLDLTEWVTEAFYDATVTGFFGPRVLDARGTTRKELYDAFEAYDHAFPIIASGLIPPFLVERIPDVKKARAAQHVLAATFADWVRNGFDGLEEGVVRDMAQVALDNGLGDYEAGKMLVADFWASMANAPCIAVRLLVTLLQAPDDLRADLQREVDSAMSLIEGEGQSEEMMTFAHLAQSLPLLGSCISETMRLETSTLSIRVVEQELVLATGAHGSAQQHVVVPADSKLVCATRAHHLNDAAWEGNAAEWDGRRFLDSPHARDADDLESKGSNWRSKRANQVYGFGGGISRCEGQHIATAELKALIAMLFYHFEARIVVHRETAEASSRFLPICFAGSDKQGWRPKPVDVGMGAYQIPEEAQIEMKIKRRRRDP